MRRRSPYEEAARWVLKRHRGKTDFFVVHGRVWDERRRRYIDHAWVEFSVVRRVPRLVIDDMDKDVRIVRVTDSLVYDRTLPRAFRIVPRDEYYRVMRPNHICKYSKESAVAKARSYRHWGPWGKEVGDNV